MSDQQQDQSIIPLAPIEGEAPPRSAGHRVPNPPDAPKLEPGAARVPSPTIAGQRCRRCGYDLTGLDRTGKCPECAFPIARSATRRNEDQLASAPVEWLRAFQAGATALLLGSVTGVAGLFLWQVSTAWPLGFWRIGAAISWVVGAWIITAPRAAAVSRSVAPREEWRTARALARWPQFAWIALAAFDTVAGAFALPAWPVLVIEIALLAVALVGVMMLMVQMSRLALWANDDDLARRAVHCVVLAPIGFVLGLLIAGSVSFAWLFSLRLFWIAVLMVFIAAGLSPLAYTLWVIARFRSMASWATLYHLRSEDKDLRQAEKALRIARYAESERRAQAGAGEGSPGATAQAPAAAPSRSSRAGAQS